MKGVPAVVLLASLAVFLVSPYIPDTLLSATVNSYVGVALLLFATLVAVRVDMLYGIAVFLAAGALFLENRKRIVSGLTGTSNRNLGAQPSQPAPVSALSEDAPPLVDGEVHPVFETPSTEEAQFRPSDEGFSNTFRPVGESINQKQPLELVPTNRSQNVADYMEAKGFAPKP